MIVIPTAISNLLGWVNSASSYSARVSSSHTRSAWPGAGTAWLFMPWLLLGQVELEGAFGAQHGVAQLGGAHIFRKNSGQLGGAGRNGIRIEHIVGSSLICWWIFAYNDIIFKSRKKARLDIIQS